MSEQRTEQYIFEGDPLSISIVCHNQYDFSIFWPQIARGRSIIVVITVLLKDAREQSLATTFAKSKSELSRLRSSVFGGSVFVDIDLSCAHRASGIGPSGGWRFGLITLRG